MVRMELTFLVPFFSFFAANFLVFVAQLFAKQEPKYCISDKVSKVDIDLENKLVNVETELSREEIYETLKKTGKTVSDTQS